MIIFSILILSGASTPGPAVRAPSAAPRGWEVRGRLLHLALLQRPRQPDALELRNRLERHSQHTWRGADSMAMFRPGGEGARYGAPIMLVISVVLALCCARQAFLWFGGRRKESCKNT